MKTRPLRIFAPIGLLLLASVFGYALPCQAATDTKYSIEQTIEPLSVRLNEEVKFEVYLKASFSRKTNFNANFYRRFTPPDLSAFVIVDKSESTQRSINIINRRYYQAYTRVITYFLRPKKQGTLVIGPSSATFNGKTYKSQSVTLTVLPPREMPPVLLEGQNPDPKYGKDIFAQAFIDRKQAYVGQPVVVTWYAYTFSRLSETPVSQLPDAPGFFNKTLLDKARFIGRVNVGSAVMLQYLLYRRVYWPQRNGELVIGARSIQLSTRDSIFSGKQYVRSTAPIKIKVLPLPTKGRPKDFFDDNVGRFSFKSDLSATSLKTNEAIDVTFTIKGEGLISAVKMGKLPALDWARLEPNGMPVVKERISGQKRVSGESQNRYILIPLKPGKHTFPAVEFAYFDPQSAKYRVARTKAVTFSVAPSGKAYNPMISASGPTATAKDNVLAPKIKPLHVQTIRGSSLRASFTGGALFWILLLVPPLGWALLGIGLLFHRRRRGDVAGKKRRELRYRRRESFKKAHQYLKSSSSPDYYGELSKIITDAVSHRIGRSAHGLTTEELAEALRRSQASQDCIDLVLETLESFDFARYAPAASSDTRAMETALSSTKSLLSRIDRLELMEVQS